MIDLTQERDVDTLRQISLLLERENQRLITKTLELTAENARLRGLPDPEQLALAELRALEQRRAQLLAPAPDATSTATPVSERAERSVPRVATSPPPLPTRYTSRSPKISFQSRSPWRCGGPHPVMAAPRLAGTSPTLPTCNAPAGS